MSNRLNRALGDWSQSAKDVKARIYTETIEGKPSMKKRKPMYIKVGAAAAVLAVGIGGAALFGNNPTTTTFNETVEGTPEVEEKAQHELRIFSETFLQIAQYEQFYNNASIASAENAKSRAFGQAIEYYALFNHLAEHGLIWDDEKRELFRRVEKQALEHDLKQPYFATYFDKMLKELNITEEQYIEEFRLVKKEYDMLSSEMYRTGKGLVEGTDGQHAYEVSKEQEEFQQKIGMPFDYLEYLAVSVPERLKPLDPQPQFSWYSEDIHLKVTKNMDGDYIFTGEDFSNMEIRVLGSEILWYIQYEKKYPSFTRISYPLYKERAQQMAAEGDETAKELLAFFVILERSIEWELEPNLVEYNEYEIPTFKEEGLRIHNDLTMQIAEYEIYHITEDLPERDYAYRQANELVGNMFGLFNYLAQDFNYGWDSETRQRYRAEVAAELAEKMESPYERAYVEELLEAHQITLDQYIDYYVLLVKEFEALQQSMVEDNVGVDYNGRYRSGLQSSRYRETVGLYWRDMYEKMSDMHVMQGVKRLEEQPVLSFDVNSRFPIEIGENAAGEHVLMYPNFISYMWTEEQTALIEQVRSDNGLPPLARYSVQGYLDAVKEKAGTKVADDVYEILTLFNRAVN